LKEEELIKKLEKNKLPKHIAIIMDGNGRWAKKRRLPRLAGHRAGIKRVREIVRFTAELGIPILTLYAFSIENWKRPKKEVDTLMFLLKDYLKKEINQLNKNKVKLNAIGRINNLPSPVQDALYEAKEETGNNEGLLLNLALSYGGRTEIIDAVNKLVERLKSAGNKKITEREFANCLYTAGIPDPDLLIRTSGEMRISNFLLWQLAYTEIWVTPVLWPDFGRKELLQALLDYQKRERRFGGIT
jgi:undecaprenyl diphosphate synthase